VPAGAETVLLKMPEEAPEGRTEPVPEGLTPMGVRVITGLLEEAREILAEGDTLAEGPAGVLTGATEALTLGVETTEGTLLEATTDEAALEGATEGAMEGATEGATEGALGTTLGAELGATGATDEVGTTDGATEGCTDSDEEVATTGVGTSGAGATGVGTTRTVEVDSSTALTERTWWTRRAWRPS
jgi:hypothetical protein